MIGRGVHIYIYLWSKKKFESYFRDRLTFSNVDSRTSRRIYRLALLLRAPETLSSLSKSRISIFNAHLTLLVRKMTSHNSIGMQLLYFITTVTSQVHSARHHQRAGYSALPSV